MTDILNLPHLRAIEVQDHGDHYRITAEGKNTKAAHCSRCATWLLYRHGSRKQVYVDAPTHGKRVLLEIDRKRYQCKSCGGIVQEPLPDINVKRDMTERLVQFIEQR